MGPELLEGCSLGAGVITIGSCRIGAWAMVAAGSVVIASVRDHELVGGVPAKHIGWVSRSGKRLIEESDGEYTCTDSGQKFTLDCVNGMVLISGER